MLDSVYAHTPAFFRLIGGNWYDPAGNLVKTIAPGAGVLYTQTEYDRLGRVACAVGAIERSRHSCYRACGDRERQ